MATLATLKLILGADIGDLKSKLGEAQGALKSMGAGVADAGKSLSLSVTAPIVGFAGAALKASTDLNAAMANVASLGVPTERVTELKSAVQDMSIEVGKSTDDLSDGLYQVISAFGDTADSVKILNTNAKAGAAGLATTTDAINLTSAVTKGWGDTSAEAVQKASDLAFVAVQLGQTTFPELAGSVGKVVPLMQSLGGTQEELFAVMATATGVTGSAAEVSTQLRGVLQSLMQPTADMTGLMQSLGFANGEAMVKSLGMKGTIDAIVGAANASGTPLGKYLSSIEGQTLAMTLAGSQSDNYVQKLAAMQDAAGATDAAFAAQTQGVNRFGFAMAQLRQIGQVFLEKFGDAIAPVLMDLVDVIRPLGDRLIGLANAFSNLSPATRRWIVIIAGAAAAIGPLLIGVGWLAGAFSAAMPVIGAIGGALGLLFSPIALVVAGIVALGAVMYRLNLGGFRDAVDGLLESVGNLATGFQTFISGTDFAAFKTTVTGAFGDIWQAVQDFFSGDISLSGLAGIISEKFGEIRQAVVDLFGGTDFSQFLTDINWDDFISKLTWENFIATLTDWGIWITDLAWDVWLVAVDWAEWITPIAWDAIVTTLTDWGEWITSLDWTTIITTAIDWATWIPALSWTAFVATVEWSLYLVALAWDAFIGAVDWANYLFSLDWGGYVSSVDWTSFLSALTWENFLSVLNWVDYVVSFAWDSFITKLEWTGTLPKLESWGTYITTLDWTQIIITAIDWALWIPILAWDGFIAALDWTTWVVSLDWSTWISGVLSWGDNVPSLSWSDFISGALAWGTYVHALPWSHWITAALDWASFVGAVVWGDFVAKLNWPADATIFAWSDWIGELSWPDLSFSWSDFVPDLTWPNLSLDWGDFIPSFPGWSALASFIGLGGGDTTGNGEALGTSYWAGGATRVGEMGPETVILPRGSQIINDRQLAAAGAGGWGGPIAETIIVRSEQDIYDIAYRVSEIQARRRGGR